jgi:Predicted Fe-S oxidoreductase
MNYISANDYMKKVFGRKIYKLSINGGFTCPNRDGTLDTRGCIFCSGSGSGDFSEDAALSVTEQIEKAKNRVEAKMPGNAVSQYLAYFQAFTNTYAPVGKLRDLYTEAIMLPEIVGISVATRPDCLPDEVIDLLAEMNQIKPVWVELGLQTVHKRSSDYIRRGYELPVYKDAVKRLTGRVSHIITHVILGLPGETKDEMLETVRYVGEVADEMKEKIWLERNSSGNNDDANYDGGNDNVVDDVSVDAYDDKDGDAFDCAKHKYMFGIKLQLLHVIRGTDLEKDYRDGEFECLTLEEYADIIREAISILPEDMVIHRITGDGAKRTLVAPLWSADKKRVLNTLNRVLRD